MVHSSRKLPRTRKYSFNWKVSANGHQFYKIQKLTPYYRVTTLAKLKDVISDRLDGIISLFQYIPCFIPDKLV